VAFSPGALGGFRPAPLGALQLQAAQGHADLPGVPGIGECIGTQQLAPGVLPVKSPGRVKIIGNSCGIHRKNMMILMIMMII